MSSKKEQILASALELFVTLGFHGASTSAIAKNAGISNGILFHYFKTKEELITELYIEIKKGMMDALGIDTITSQTEGYIKHILGSTISWGVKNPDKYYYIQQVHFSPYIKQIPERLQELYMKPYFDMIETAKAEKIIKNLPTYLILSILSGQINAMCDYIAILENHSPKNIEDGVEIIWDIIRIKN